MTAAAVLLPSINIISRPRTTTCPSLTGRLADNRLAGRGATGWHRRRFCHRLIKIRNGNCYAKRSHSSSYGVFVEMRTLMTFGKCSGFRRNSVQQTTPTVLIDGRKMESSMLATLLLLDSNNKSTSSSSLLGDDETTA